MCSGKEGQTLAKLQNSTALNMRLQEFKHYLPMKINICVILTSRFWHIIFQSPPNSRDCLTRKVQFIRSYQGRAHMNLSQSRWLACNLCVQEEKENLGRTVNKHERKIDGGILFVGVSSSWRESFVLIKDAIYMYVISPKVKIWDILEKLVSPIEKEKEDDGRGPKHREFSYISLSLTDNNGFPAMINRSRTIIE